MLNNLYPDINGNTYKKSGIYLKVIHSYYCSDVNGLAIEHAYDKIVIGHTIKDTIIIAGLRTQAFALHKKKYLFSMSLQDEIIDINGNKITDECVCVEHHPDGDTYESSSITPQANSHPNLLYYTRLFEKNSKRRTRKYTQYTYKIKK